VVVLLPLAIVFGGPLLWRKDAPQSANTPGAPATTTTEPQGEAFGWLMQAMAECDAYAKQNENTLYFLIVPLTPSASPVPGWRPQTIGNLGSSAALLSSGDALIGLRNGGLELYRKPLTFAVSDPDTKTVYKWKPFTGVSELKSRAAATAAALALGIQLENENDVQWGPTIGITKGTCYWTNPIIARGS
jgi:hypothetical protein